MLCLSMLQLSGLNLQHDTFDKSVCTFGVVTLLQTGTEQPCEGLIEASAHGAEESLYEFVAR